MPQSYAGDSRRGQWVEDAGILLTVINGEIRKRILVGSSVSFGQVKSYAMQAFSLSPPCRIYKDSREIILHPDVQCVGNPLQDGDTIQIEQCWNNGSEVLSEAGDTSANSVRPSVRDDPHDYLNPPERNMTNLPPRNIDVTSPNTPQRTTSPSREYRDNDEDLARALSASLLDEVHSEITTPSLPETTSSVEPGIVTCEGTVSQFVVAGGAAACTEIAILAARHFLEQDARSATVPALDTLVEKGAELHRRIGRTTTFNDLWTSPLLQGTVSRLCLGDVHEKVLGPSGDFVSALTHALDFDTKYDSGSNVATLIRKSDEAILCLFQHGRWYLFDSHGQVTNGPKAAFIKRFNQMHDLASELLSMYPYQDLRGSPHSRQINGFEAYPIALLAEPPRGPCSEGFGKVDVEDNKQDLGASPPAYPSSHVPGVEHVNKHDPMANGGPPTNPASQVPSAEHGDKQDPSANGASPSQPFRAEHSNRQDQAGHGGPPPCPASQVTGAKHLEKQDPKTNVTEQGPPTRLSPPTIPVAPKPIKSTREAKAPGGPNTKAAKPPRTVTPPPSKQPSLPEFFEQDDFVDPMTLEVMADPVTCDDGNTYERSGIEKWFRERVQAEEQRRDEAEHRDGGERTESNDDTCCGARAPIQLTSPMTGETVSARLVPNRALERQIVRMVERNALGMKPEEIEDWKKRRDEKTQNDRKRYEQERREQERQAEMRKNAEEAMKRREKEASSLGGAPDAPLASIPEPDQVRLVRNTRDASQRRAENDTGLAVALCGDDDRVDPALVASSGFGYRCMVACCASIMTDPQWCARCGRIVCRPCLDFGATNIVDRHTPIRDICFDCLNNVTDKLVPANRQIAQAMALLQKLRVDKHSRDLANRATAMQDRVVHQETLERCKPRIDELSAKIANLSTKQDRLWERTEEAKAKAERARNDDPDRAPSPPPTPSRPSATYTTPVAPSAARQSLADKCARLQARYSELIANASGDQNAFIELSKVQDELEQAQVEMSIQDSMPSSQGMARDTPVATSATVYPQATTSSLADKCARLQARYSELIANASGDESAFIELSKVQADLEQAQLEMLMAESVQTAPAAATTAPTQTPSGGALTATDALIAALENHQPSERRPGRLRVFGRKRNDADNSVRLALSRLKSIRSELQRLLQQSNGSNMVRLAGTSKDFVSTVENQLPGHIKTIFTTEIEAAKAELQRAISVQTSPPPPPVPAAVAPTVHAKPIPARATVGTSHQASTTTTTTSSSSRQKRSPVQPPRRPRPFRVSVPTPSFMLVRDVSSDRENLDALGKGCGFDDWPLPWGMEYPTDKMKRLWERFQNDLQLARLESQRKWDKTLGDYQQELTDQANRLEDEVDTAESKLHEAEKSAQEQQRQQEERRRQREERRRREEEERRQRERIRMEQERVARAERERLRGEEEEAQRLFARAAQNREGNASLLGGTGDLRMCKRCKAGPIMNNACRDLSEHNNADTTYKDATVQSTQRPNHCPNCNWFDAEWHNWPYWDGVYGPH